MADVTSISNLASQYINEALSGTDKANNISSMMDPKTDAFSSLLASAMEMVTDTNNLSNAANAEQMNFALGYSDNTHDLAIAQQKAALSLQYTVAVKNKVLEAYKELMNMQI